MNDVIAAVVGTVVVLVVLLTITWLLIRRLRRRARRMGYPGVLIYLRAMPRNGAEKRDAVRLFALGLVLSFLGIIFHAFLIIGLVPLYYGCRKIGEVMLGSAFPDEDTHTEQSGAEK